MRKKDPSAIRMIVDARITNCHHRRPPVTRLGSAVNYMDLGLSEELLGGQAICENGYGWGSEMGVSDCFYRFDIKEMASWFGIDAPNSVDYWNSNGFDLHSVFDEDMLRNVPVNSSDVLCPVIAVMPMGRTWALFFANETVASIVRECSKLGAREMREKLPVPQLDEAPTITSTYVDNVAIGHRRTDRGGSREADYRDRSGSCSKRDPHSVDRGAGAIAGDGWLCHRFQEQSSPKQTSSHMAHSSCWGCFGKAVKSQDTLSRSAARPCNLGDAVVPSFGPRSGPRLPWHAIWCGSAELIWEQVSCSKLTWVTQPPTAMP